MLVLGALIWTSSRAGFARLLTAYAVKDGVLEAADEAVRIEPGDADAHLVRGDLFAAADDLAAAIKEYEQASIERPNDYVSWLSLARARELIGESASALEAANRAVALAPSYAQPRWQLGNVLIRSGRRDEGFRELSRAAAYDPSLWPSIIDLAWQISHGNIEFVKQSVPPQSVGLTVALAEYLAKRGAVAEAVSMLRIAGTGDDAIAARQKYVGELLAQGHFSEAAVLWNLDHKDERVSLGELLDGRFEQERSLDGVGFDWRSPNRSPNVLLALDTNGSHDGRSSLLVEFKGESNPGNPIIAQLILVEPHAHYALRLSVQTENLISGGLPEVNVVDAGSNKVLASTGTLPKQTNGWREYSIDFTSLDSTNAIRVVVQRQQCSNGPCPIFGKLWLDNFILEKPQVPKSKD